MTCQDCKYWRSFKGDKEKGQCLINPPTVSQGYVSIIFIGFSCDTTSWPTVAYDDWCGQHIPRI